MRPGRVFYEVDDRVTSETRKRMATSCRALGDYCQRETFHLSRLEDGRVKYETRVELWRCCRALSELAFEVLESAVPTVASQQFNGRCGWLDDNRAAFECRSQA